MLKRDPKANFKSRTTFFGGRKVYRFYFGKLKTVREWEESDYLKLIEQQRSFPQLIATTDIGRRYWMFIDEFYWEDAGLDGLAVSALVLDKFAKQKKQVDRAMARLAQQGTSVATPREPISDEVKIFVWQRDAGRCAKCGSNQNLEYDHIIPLSKGGSNTARNIQLLCEIHNREKGGNIV